jgi:hypothetical protein
LGWGCGGSRGAVATGNNLAVSTNGVFAGGAGASREERVSNTNVCKAIEAKTLQTKARSCRGGWSSAMVAAEADIG